MTKKTTSSSNRSRAKSAPEPFLGQVYGVMVAHMVQWDDDGNPDVQAQSKRVANSLLWSLVNRSLDHYDEAQSAVAEAEAKIAEIAARDPDADVTAQVRVITREGARLEYAEKLGCPQAVRELYQTLTGNEFKRYKRGGGAVKRVSAADYLKAAK